MGSALPGIGTAAGAGIGGFFGGPAGASIGAGIGGAVGTGLAGDKGRAAAPGLRRIGTGRSSFTRSGSNNNALDIEIDPRINQGQEDFLTAVRGFRDPVNSAFGAFQEELGGIRDEVTGLRSDFEGNQSAFREASLAPLQERIARGEGALNTELGRTGVRGTFADQSRSNFQLDAGRTLSNQEAQIENQRINNLGNLLGMDADLLKVGLSSEQGRINMLMGLEESLRGISTERFNQEMQLLSQGTGITTTPFQQAAQANREGIFAGQLVRSTGEILEGIDMANQSSGGFNSSQSTQGGNSINNFGDVDAGNF